MVNKNKEKTVRGKHRAKQRFLEILKKQYKLHKGATITYILLRALIVLIMVLTILNRNWENAALCAFSLLLFVVPSVIEENLHIEVPSLLETFILIFIFAAQILGEIGEFYIYLTYWDTMLHTINGFLSAAVGLSLVELLNKTDRFHFDLSPFFLVLFAFCFSMTIGVFWEFFEFSQDYYMGYDMQKDTLITSINSVVLSPSGGNNVESIKNIVQVTIDGYQLPFKGYLDIGLIDTMKDLFVNFIGAAIFAFFGYFYEKYKGEKNNWVGNLMPHSMDEERIDEINNSRKRMKKNKIPNKEIE